MPKKTVSPIQTNPHFIKHVPKTSFTHSPWPDCEIQMMSVHPDAVEYPGTHGTGFFINDGQGTIFLITARHCLGDLQADLAERVSFLCVPFEMPQVRTTITADGYVRFSRIRIIRALERQDEFFGNDIGDLDLVALEVAPTSPDAMTKLRARAVVIPPTGEWFETICDRHFAEGDSIPVTVRGFPSNGTESEIDFEACLIIAQGRTFIADCIGQGAYPHTKAIVCRGGEEGRFELDGISGSPVRLRASRVDDPPGYALVGMMLRGYYPNSHFVTVPWITRLIRQEPTDFIV